MRTDYLYSTSLITQLVDRMMLNQELSWAQEMQEQMPPRVFAEEFQTVRIKAARRAGHSSAAALLWNKYDGIVVLPEHRSLDYFVKEILRQGGLIENAKDITQTRCISADRYSLRHMTEIQQRLLPLRQNNFEPQLLIFDQASTSSARLEYEVTEQEVHDIVKQAKQLYDWGEWSELKKMITSLTTPPRSFDEAIQIWTGMIRHTFPSIKGVAILQ